MPAVYGDQRYLDAFDHGRGKYPDIHNDLYAMVATEAVGDRFIDLCGSTGLLGERIARKLGGYVIGIDADEDAVLRGREAGVAHDRRVLKVVSGDGSLDELCAFIHEHSVTVLVARRCLSEVFAPHAPGSWWPCEFARSLAGVGISEVFVQGRALDPRATHPYATVAAEVAPFLNLFDVHTSEGQIAYLTRKRA